MGVGRSSSISARKLFKKSSLAFDEQFCTSLSVTMNIKKRKGKSKGVTRAPAALVLATE